MKTLLHPWQNNVQKGYSFVENDSFVIKNVKWEHNCQMQTDWLDWNFHRHVTAKSKMSMESFTDTFPLLVKSRWLLLPTLYIQEQMVDGIFHRHFPTECKLSMEFFMENVDDNFHRHFTNTRSCKLSTEFYIDISVTERKRRWKIPSTFWDFWQNVDKTTLHRKMSIQISIDVWRLILAEKNRWIYLKNKNTSVSHQKEYGQEKFSNL